MQKTLSLLLLVLSVSALAAKPAAVVFSQTALNTEELFSRIVLAPQWLKDTEVVTEKIPFAKWKHSDYDRYSAVFFLFGTGQATGLKLMNFSPEAVAAMGKFVNNGGILFFIADTSPKPGSMKNTGKLAKLLGAEKFTAVKKITIPQDAPDYMQQWNAVPEIFKSTFSSALNGLSGITTAKVLAGTPDGAVMTVNAYGKGKVVFLSGRLSTSGASYYPVLMKNPSVEQFFPIAKALYAQLDTKALEFKSGVKREIWEAKPLGKKVNGFAEYTRRTPVKLTPKRKMVQDKSKSTLIVVNGKAQATIVVPGGAAGNSSRAAANVLNALLKKSSGAVLPVKVEKAMRNRPPAANNIIISIGNTAYNKDLPCPENGVAVDVSPYLIRIKGAYPALAVMRFMQEFLGYQRLWPGADGEVFTVSSDIAVANGSYEDAPAYTQRTIRDILYRNKEKKKLPDGKIVNFRFGDRIWNGSLKLGVDPESLDKHLSGFRNWPLEYNLGGSINMGGGGTFYDWRKRYEKSHPEFFALQFDGKRIATGGELRMCKSNPANIQAAAAKVMETIARRPEIKYFIIEPCDGGYDIYCMCPECRKLDPDLPPSMRYTRYVYRMPRNRITFHYPPVSDRYLAFSVKTAEIVGKKYPDVKICYMAYSHYFDRPALFNGKLPANMAVVFVGYQYMSDQARAKARETYDFWASTANELIVRPNFLHSGFFMPVIYAKEMAQDLLHSAENGAIAGDFDSITHNWATQGFNYYALGRLLWNPLLTEDELMDEYVRGFGNAKDKVKEYLKSVSANTRRIASGKAETTEAIEDRRPSSSYASKLHIYYPPALLASWRKILESARAAVPENSMEQRRVDFLLAGLEFTETESEMRRLAATTKSRKTLLPQTLKHIEKLKAIYARHPFAVNMPLVSHNEWYELWYHNGWRQPENKDVKK